MLVQSLCNACGLRRRREEAKADKGLDTHKEKGNGESSSSEDVKNVLMFC